LSIGGDYTTSAVANFLSVTDSTLRVLGSVVDNNGGLIFDGSKAVIGGDLIGVEDQVLLSTIIAV
jgi:hypothetical protein